MARSARDVHRGPPGFDAASLPPKVQRVRTGCLKCKERRVKCDERRPQCNRCHKIGFAACRYERVPDRKVSNASAASASSEASGNSSSSLSSESSARRGALVVKRPPQRPQLDQTTRVALQFLEDRNVVVAQARQRFADYTIAPATVSWVAANLWTDAQAKMFDTEPAFRHLQNAYSALSLAVWCPDVQGSEIAYFRSVTKVYELIRTNDLVYRDEMVMFCCMVLTVCEYIRTANVKTAWPHRISGLKIMDDWSATLHTLPEKHRQSRLRLMSILKPAFFCGGMTASALLDEGDDSVQHRDATMKQVPPVFYSFQNAAVSLENIFIFWVMPLLRPQSSWIAALDPSKVDRLLEQWKSAYDAVRNQPPTGDKDLIMEPFLDMHFTTAKLVTQMLTDRQEDLGLAGFEVILSKLRAILSATDSKDPHRSIHRPLGLVPPAFFVAVHAADDALRREACEFLKNMSVVEAAWTSRVAWRIAEMILQATSASGNPQDLPSPPHSTFHGGNIRLKEVNCRIEEQRVIMTVTYDDWVDYQWHAKSIKTPYDEAEDREDCLATAWPLKATFQSWGYIGSNLFPAPYFHSVQMVKDRLTAQHMMQQSAAAAAVAAAPSSPKPSSSPLSPPPSGADPS